MDRSRVRARVDAWGEAQRRGIAGDLCDRIVRERPVPDRLLMALMNPRYMPLLEEEQPLLTPREKEIVRCFGSGLRYRDVIAQLGISHNTIDTHKRRIKAKLQARNMAHAYAICYRAGQLA